MRTVLLCRLIVASTSALLLVATGLTWACNLEGTL